MLAAVPDVLGVGQVSVGADRPEDLVLDDLGKADDGVERGAQLVAHVGEEEGLRAVRHLGVFLGSAKLLLNELLTADIHDVAVVELLARSEEHTSELQSLMRISYAVFCLKK